MKYTEVTMCGTDFGRTFIVAFLLVGSTFAQTTENRLRSTVIAVRYPPLAEAARIQGDVRLSVKPGAVTIVSGNPLLAQTAVQSAKALGSISGTADLDVVYHFVLVDTTTSVPTSIAVKRGDAFERAILRIFGLKTEKVVVVNQCQEGVAPPNDFKLAGQVPEVWIYGTIRCLETEASTLVAVKDQDPK
jgi:hypothetical protein